MQPRNPTTATGFLFAIGSAASFALSGVFASSLMDAGWSPGAAVTARISFAALVLLAPTCVMMSGNWDLVRRAWKSVVLFGTLAVAGCQLAFFLAVEHIPPSLALLIEFMGPVLLMLWIWARTRTPPHVVTLLGAFIALGGLVAISGVAAGGALHTLGIFFALIAAVGNAAYYATSAASSHGIPPLPFVGLGLVLAAVMLALASVTGLLPFTVATHYVILAGHEVSPWVAITGMVFISTVMSYVLGVGAARRLGATVASFTGYSEPLFGILWTIVLLAVIPTSIQWIGAAFIITGVITVKIGEVLRARSSLRTRP